MTTLTNQARSSSEADVLAINTIRTLAMDAVQAANSGHPGTPMGLAPVAYTLWQRYLRFDPQDPIWPNRDRFVLSAGHASMLLYALLHLAGVNAVNPAVRGAGRAVGAAGRHQDASGSSTSKCPGHPEYRWTSGVESHHRTARHRSSPPRVGMAIAARWLGGALQPSRLRAVRLRHLRRRAATAT